MVECCVSNTHNASYQCAICLSTGLRQGEAMVSLLIAFRRLFGVNRDLRYSSSVNSHDVDMADYGTFGRTGESNQLHPVVVSFSCVNNHLVNIQLFLYHLVV